MNYFQKKNFSKNLYWLQKHFIQHYDLLPPHFYYYGSSWNHRFFELDLCLPLLMMNDGAIAMVADSEQRLSVRLCAETIFIAPTHTIFECLHHSMNAFRWSRRRCSIRADSVSRNFVIIRLPLSTFWRSNFLWMNVLVMNKVENV